MSKTKFRAPLRFRSCAVCLRGSESETEILLVRMADPLSRLEFWVPPGGGVEPGETSQQTALRETLEETGEVVTVADSEPITLRYDFDWNGKIHDCQTAFHLCTPKRPFAEPLPVKDAAYIIEARWFPLAQGLELLRFHEAIYNAVKATLESHS